MERRLSTILAADVVDYSSRMGADESDTLARLSLLADLLHQKMESYEGRVFNRSGDGFMVEFSSPVLAVRAGYELQQQLAAPQSVHDIGLHLRVGIHLADVIAEQDDLLGDGVNIASRIESIAEAGTVLISSTVFDCVKRNAHLQFETRGEVQLKNISDPVAIYKIVGELGKHSCGTALMLDDALARSPNRATQVNSIAVVPFENASSDPDQEYFADGFTEDLITELSRFPDVMTISRNASFGLKDKRASVQEIGQKLGVQFCLEGSIRRLGNKIRVSVYLTEAETGEQVWASRYDTSLDELFDVQDEITAKIVSCVAGQIERQAHSNAKRKRPTDLEAYDCLLRGLEYHRVGGVTQENAEKALSWFDRALSRDPEFGRAHAWRACALATVAEWTGEDVWDELLEVGRVAVELDETDAETHRIAGSLGLYARDFDKALFHFHRALELNPNHAFLVGRMGEVYNFLGDGKTALEYQKRARVLDPFLPEYCRELEVVAYYCLGDFQTCVQTVNEFTRVSRRAAAYRCAAYVNLGDRDAEGEAARHLLAIDPAFDPKQFVLTEFYKDPKVTRQLQQELSSALSHSFALAG